MKKNLALFALLLMGTVMATNHAKAQDRPASFPLCIHDDAGYIWNFNVTRSGDNFTAIGTVDVNAGYLWDATGSWNSTTGVTVAQADNPQADGCNSHYIDYFVYTGTATAGRSGGAIFYNGSGTYESFCPRGVVNTGTWSATDCAHFKGGTINRNGPAKHTVK